MDKDKCFQDQGKYLFIFSPVIEFKTGTAQHETSSFGVVNLGYINNSAFYYNLYIST